MLVTGERVLVVEDDFYIGRSSELTLAQAGYTARLAQTADQAITVAHEFRPDLMVMDINLGRGRDGIDVAAEILRDLGIRSIFATAYGYGGLQVRADAVRPLGWLGKPFSSLSLVTEVRRALQTVTSGDPIVLSVDDANDVLLVAVDGVLTDGLWSDMQAAVARFIAARGPHRGIVDFTGITRVDVTQRE
ncbi:MAG TPA: response regulator, partial [Reyranellaceae bacterium]|nr:response regulator [Reyranellaceae bacterium]